MKNTKVMISLGEIVTPNLMKGAFALAKTLSEKSEGKLDFENAKNTVFQVVQTYNEKIENFKMGQISEKDFDQGFLALIKEKTEVTLTTQEFNDAWDQMNPDYAGFVDNLSAAIAFNKKDNKELVIVSFSNPKDNRHLINELTNNFICHKVDISGNLSEIDGIKIYFTYVNKKSKAELIKGIIKEFNDINYTNQASSVLFPAFSFFSEELEKNIVQYIYGVNKIKDFESLKKSFEADTCAVKDVAKASNVTCVLWNKSILTRLSDFLNKLENNEGLEEKLSADDENDIAYRCMPVAKL